MRIRLHRVLLILLGALAGATVAAPPHDSLQGQVFVDSDGVAIAGYDAVSYFDSGKPLKGAARWLAEYKGARFLFASREHLDRFRGDPEKFVPQFGGYCAAAMAEGKVRRCNPRRFSIQDGKLFLFSSEKAQEDWESQSNEWIAKALSAWKHLVSAASTSHE